MGSMGEVVARFGADISGYIGGLATMGGASAAFGGTLRGIFSSMGSGFSKIGEGAALATSSFQKMGRTGFDAWAGIRTGLVQVGQGAIQAGGSLLQLSAHVVELGAKLAFALIKAVALSAVVAGVLAVAIGTIAVRAAGDFERQIVKLYTTAGEAKNNLQMVGDGILAMTGQVGTGAKQLGDAMYWIESAGLHGARALEALRVAAQAAKAENANLDDVSKALAASLNAYSGSGMSAVRVMNILTAATGQGMMSFGDLAGSLKNVLPASARFGISLIDVTAALSTMTAQGDDAATAATHLRQMILALEAPTKIGAAALKSVGLTSKQVADEMKVSLPGALQMITDAVGKKFPAGSEAYKQAIKDIAGGSKQMMGFLELTGSHLHTFAANVGVISTAVKKGGHDLLGWADIQKTLNFQVDAAKASVGALAIAVGNQLLPFVTGLVTKIVPLITAFTEWVNKTQVIQHAITGLGDIINKIGAAFNAVFHPVQQVTQALAPLTDSFTRATAVIKPIASVVNPMLDSFTRATGIIKPVTASLNPMADSFDRATSVIRTTGPAAQQTVNVFTIAVTIFHAVADAITFFVGVYHTVSAVITASIPVFQRIWAVLQQVGTFIASTFAPVWAQLVTSFHDVMAAIQPILPQLQQLGMLIGGVVVVALVLVVAALAGLATGLAQVLIGVAQFVTGVIQFFSGLVQVISGIVQLLVDLISGHFDRISTDIDRIMTGILAMMIGVWNMIRGLWTASIGAVIALATGFVMAVINIFIGLYNALVGHSIIPDMINAIVRVFATLAGLVTGPINNAVHTILSILQGAVSSAMSAGSAIVNGIASGLRAAAGAVTNAMGFIGGIIHNMMPHSPAKEGPLRALDTYGPALAHTFAAGILKGAPEVRAAVNMLVTPVGGTLGGALPPGSGGSGRSGQSNATYIIQINGQDLIRALGPGLASELRLVIGGV